MISIVVVAPYCPAERGGAIALGGAAKQKAVLAGLEACGKVTLLVNSGHQREGWSQGLLRRFGKRSIELQPPLFPWRPLGKLLQALWAPVLGYRIQRRCRPAMVWVYNSYLFESLYVLGATLADPRLTVMLELEDMPLARARSGTGWIKAQLDAWSLGFLVRKVAGATVVQNEMREQVLRDVPRVWFLPVLLSPQVKPKDFVPVDSRLSVGYFGGLTREKGADKLLRVVVESPDKCRWLISGTGEFARHFAELQITRPDKMRFIGAVDENTFRRAFNEAQVLVNLHTPLSNFGQGVFPFKLLEAVAGGKLVLSTEAHGCPPQVSDAIHWLRGDPVGECLAALRQGEKLLMQTTPARERARDWVVARFQADIVMSSILGELKI